jgi:hypothetical protein
MTLAMAMAMAMALALALALALELALSQDWVENEVSPIPLVSLHTSPSALSQSLRSCSLSGALSL